MLMTSQLKRNQACVEISITKQQSTVRWSPEMTKITPLLLFKFARVQFASTFVLLFFVRWKKSYLVTWPQRHVLKYSAQVTLSLCQKGSNTIPSRLSLAFILSLIDLFNKCSLSLSCVACREGNSMLPLTAVPNLRTIPLSVSLWVCILEITPV